VSKIVFTELEKLIEQLSTHVDELIEQVQSNPLDSESEVQLREISKAIERIESSGISIPAALLDKKSRLLSIVGSNKGNQDQAISIYNRLNTLVIKLRSVVLTKSRGNSEESSSSDTTSWRVVAKAVIDTFRQERRQMRRTEIWEAVFSMLQDRMHPGDYEPAQHNGRPFWKNTVSRVLYNLRKENIIKPAIQHGYHELEEVYYENQTPFD